jgi:SAM-dependent methyltransferase
LTGNAPGGRPDDARVGSHYEDPARAAGLARLYQAETALGEFYRDRMRRIAGLLEGIRGDLLDAGCGTGQMIRHLRDSRPGELTLTGLDRSESVLDVARGVVENDPAIRFVVGRLEQMPLPDTAFDVVLVMGSLEYVTDVEQAVAEVARVTRPGGLAIVTMQNRWSPYRLWDATVWSTLQRRRGSVESPIVHRLGERRLGRVLAAAGLEPLSVINYGFRLVLPPFDTRFPRFAIGAERRLARIARGPLRRVATDYIVVARRGAAPNV